MFKHLQKLLLIASLCVPWVTQAQSDCTPISTFPVTYGFEASEGFTTTVTAAAACTTNVFNNCWRNEQTTFNGTTGSGRIWHIYGGTTAAQIHSGAHSLTLPDKGSSSAGVSKTMLTFPAMNFTSSNGYVVSFWIYRNGTGSNPEGFKIYASPTDTIGPGAVEIGHYSRIYTLPYPQVESASGWYEYETAPITMTGTVYIIFEGQSYYGNSTYVDDITIMEAPTCPKPTAVLVDSISYDAASIVWQHPTGNANSFRVYTSTTPNIDVTTATYQTAYDTSIVLDNLQPLTTYYYTIVADCGNGDYSIPTEEKHFTTRRYCGDDLVNLYDVIGTATTSGTAYVGYSSTSYPLGHSACIFTAQEMIDLGLDVEGTIHSISVHAGSTGCTMPLRVYIGKTAATEFSSASDTVGMLNNMTLVFDDTIHTSPQEWVTIPFDTPYTYAPDSNIILYFYREGTSSAAGNFYYTTTTPVYSAFTGYKTATSTSNITFTRSYLRANVLFDICYELPSCIRPSNIALDGVDENTISLTWTGCNNATSYLVTYAPAGSSNYETESSNTNSITLINLTPGTTYDFEIRSICGSDTTYGESFRATTLCAEINILPYVMSFEGANTGTTSSPDFVNCLTRHNSTTSYYPYVSSTVAYCHSGNRGLYWYCPTTTGAYQYVVLPAIDTNQYEINTLQLKLWARATSTSYNPTFAIGVMSHPDSLNSFQPIQTISVGGNTTYSEFTVPLGSFEGYGNYIAIRGVVTGSAWYANVDDITIEEMPNCPPVTDIEAVATVGNALLTWDYMPGYDEPDGYVVTYDSVGGSSPTTVSVTDPTITLTGLVPGTSYKVYVNADCGGDNGIIDSVLFSTGVLGCIELDPTSVDSIGVGNGTVSTYYVPIGQYYKYSYTQQLVLASELEGPAAITGIDFEYGYATATTQKTNVTIYLANTTTSDLSSAFVPYSAAFVPVYSGPLNGTQGWNHYEFTTPFNYDGTSNLLIIVHDNSNAYPGSAYIYKGHAASGKARYIQNDSSPYDINTVSGGTSYANRANMHFWTGDCQTMAVCAAPVVTLTDVTATTADITWIPGYDDNSWDLSYREAGTTTWTTAATGETSTEYQFTNLTPGTDYELRVSFECNDANNTVYSSIVNARTNCSFVTLPYTYGFEDMPTGTSSVHPDIPCWHHLNNGTSYGGYPYVYASAAHSGSRGLYWYLAATTTTYGDYEVVVLPAVDTTINPVRNLQLSFWAKPTSTSYAPVFYVGVMSDPADITTFEYVDTINVVSGNTNWSLYESSLSHYTGEGTYVALRANRPTSAWYAYTDDFTLDTLPSCPHVTHLTVDSTSQNSVSLSWNAGSTETEWSVTDGTNYYTTTTPYITVTGLETNTPYTFEVRSLCTSDDSSAAWTISARTECDPYLALPYSENFDSYTTSTTAATGVEIPCWGRLMTGTSTYQTGSYLPMLYYYNNSSSAVYTHSGLYSLRLYGVGYHTLPQLPCPADSVTIGFWAKTTSSSYKLYLGVMSDPDDASTFDTIQEITYNAYTAAGAFQYFEFNLSNYTGTGRYIAFRNVYTSATTYYSYHYIDDIEVWHNTACPSPAVNVGTVTNNSIEVTWMDTTGNSYTNGVTVMWNTANTTSGAQSVTVGSGNSYTITGLEGSTTYYIWVAGECATESSRPIAVEATTYSNCGVVENLTLSGVDHNAFGISWNAPSVGNAATSYVVYLRQCTNTPYDNQEHWIMDTTTNTYYMFNGLDEATTYAYAVRTLCGTEWADYDGGYVTTTICEMDTVGDYAVNYSAQPVYATQPYSYTQQIYLASELNGIDSINSLAFYQRGYSYNDRNVTVYLGYTNKTEFESTTDYVPMSHLTQVYSGRLSGFGWVSLKFDTTYVRVADSNLVVALVDNTGTAYTANCYWACSKYENPNIYRAMRLYSSSAAINPAAPSGTYGRDYYRAYIVFGNAACETDGCATPIVMQSATYADHVDISWNATAGTSYDIDYRALGADNWTSVATGNTTGTATITGLGASFLGEARVSYSCNGQTVSGITQIQTLCGPASLPIAEDFQNYDYGHFTRNCWVTGLTNAAAADREYPYVTALTGATDNMLCMLYYGAYVILPEVDTNLSACQIRFKLTQGAANVRLLLGVIDDATMPIQTMHVLDTIIRSDYDTTSSTASITYSFENIPAAYNHSRIAFWDAFSDNYNFLDDIVVELIPACTPASDISAVATVNSATISWNTNGENATSYYVIYGPRGFSAGQGDTVVATGSPVTLTGLNHSTNYDAYVYTVCDLLNATSTPSAVVQFTTDCAPYTTLPYVMNFENLLPAGSSIATILPNCWASETGSSAVAHVVYTTNSNQATSPQHAFLMSENGVVALPEMGVPLNTLMLSFHECNTNPQSYGLIIGTVDNVNTGFAQTFVPYDTVVFTDNQSLYNVTSYLVDYTGTANRLAIRNYNTGTGNVSEHYIDDLVIDLAPACIPPQNVHAGYLVDNQADIVWSRSNSSSYTVEYGIHGFTFGTGTQTTVTTRSISLTGLTSQTQYDVYVMSACDTVFYTFTTPCAAVSLPYLENFDSYTTSTTAATGVYVPCWDKIMTGTSTYQTGSYLPQIYYSSSYAHSGSYCYRLYGVGYHMLPPMPTSLDSLQLTFYDYTSGTSYGLEVGVMEGNNFIPIQTINSPTSTSTEHTVYFGSYTGPSRIIAFRNYYTSGTTTYYSYHYIDDIEVDYLPTCPPVTSLQATSVTTTSATIDWTDLATNASQWEVEYAGNGSTNSVVVQAHPATINGLTPATAYAVRVRPICSATDTGAWCHAINVASGCDLIVPPYVQNFDEVAATTYSTAGLLPPCWDGYTNGTSAVYTPHVVGSGSYWYADSANSLIMTSGSATYGDVKIARLPQFATPVNTLTMSFWMSTESSTNGYLLVGYMTGYDHSTFVAVDSIHASSTTYHGSSSGVSALGYRDTVDFSAAPATAQYIAFKWVYTTSFYSCCIDDVEVTSTGAVCNAPVELPTTDITYNSATVHWNSNATEFEVAVKAANEATWPAETTVSNATSYAVSGLTPATPYQFRVRAICDATEELISDWTVVNFVTDSLPCFAPSALTLEDAGMNTATFTWTANGEENAWSIHVWNTAFNQSYDVTANPATVTGLTKNTTYYAAVQAICGNGAAESEFSDTISFTTADCPIPTGVAVNNVTTNAATVTWSGTAASYVLEYGPVGFPEGEGTMVNNITGTSYTLTGLNSSYSYDVYVMANCDGQNSSNWSNPVTFTTQVGIDGVNGVNVTLYPNPASQSTTVTLSGVSGEVTITIVDMNGRTVRTEQMSCEGDCVKTMEVSGLAQGAYFVRVNGDNVNMVKKLVVK